MDNELFKNIFSAIPSLITLVITLIAILRRQFDRTDLVLDSPSLKIFTIIREPLNQENWKKLKESDTEKYTIIFSVISIVYILFAIYSYFNRIYILTIADLILIFITFLISRYLLRFYFPAFIFKRPDISARYFAFQKIVIVIDANYHYLFNKCHQSLININCKVTKVSEGEYILEASLINFLSLGNSRMIRVTFEKLANYEDVYMLNFKFEFEEEIGIAERSRITNRFIDQLISKSKTFQQGDNILKNPSGGGE